MRSRVCCSLLLAAVSQCIGGTILYDNGPPATSFGGIQMTTQLLAEDFSLPYSSLLTGVRFWSLEARGTTVYQGSIYWGIYSNTASNLPTMVPLFSGLLLSPNKVATGRTADLGPYTFDEYQYDFALPNILLSPGTWWLALHHGPLSFIVVDQFSWQQTNPNATFGTAVQNTVGNPWISSGTQSAFQLSGEVIPEPSSIALVGIGLTTLAWFSRRRSGFLSESIE